MAFQQKKLDKSINQSRGVFDKFIYKPDNGDTVADILAMGYFDQSRFISDPDWVDSIMELIGSDGYVIGQIQADNTVLALYNSTTGGGGSTPTIVRVSGDYQILVGDDYVITDGGNTITLPLLANAVRPVFIVNEGVTNDTIDGNGETVPNGTTLTPSQVRGFIAGTSEWREL